MSISLLRIPGPAWDDGRIITRHIHRFQIIVTEDYPYERPIVKWQTPVFHPNIMTPEDGGYVCTKLLERWEFKSDLVTFIKGIEILLANPNPDNPFGSDSCTRAAEYFRSHRYSPPSLRAAKSQPKIIGGDADG
jgi:ubiquitin-conjugating enzyme E2 C